MLRYSTAADAVSTRVTQTVRLLARRGFALTPRRLGELCLGGTLDEDDVRWAVAAARGELALVDGLVVGREQVARAKAIGERAAGHATHAARYFGLTERFTRTLVAVAPFIRSVWVAGSLATGGFRDSDDVDLNLVVDDGHRHLAYVAVNVLGVLHALAYRSKPVDDLTRRPVAPRLMTANLILERSETRPLARQDDAMAFELLISEPVHGWDVYHEIVASNAGLLDHYPQLAEKRPAHLVATSRWAAPGWLYPAFLDGAARTVGAAAWRYMQWTRRNRPEALARVAFVRETMRPYTLFDEGGTWRSPR